MQNTLHGLAILLCLLPIALFGQSTASSAQEQGDPSASPTILNFPSRLFGRIQAKTAGLNQQLTTQTEKYLARLQRREDKLRRKLYRVDSTAANNLFPHPGTQYAAIAQKIRQDTGSSHQSISGEYQPNTDSLRGTLSFLQQNPQLLGGGTSAPAATLPGVAGQAGISQAALPALAPQVALSPQAAKLQGSIQQLQALQAKMQDADQLKAYVQQRKQQISDYISQHANLQGLLGSQYAGMNQDLYYYSQQVRQYKEMLNNPDQLEQKALSLLDQLPAFQNFMKNNSQLAGLFSLPGNYGSAAGLEGLQTKDQIGQLIQSQVTAGGAGGAAALQSNLQSAESQLNTFKDKLSQLGGGSGDIDMPDFKPNDQKTKTLWKRLEYGTNFQTTRNSYYFPTVANLGLSVAYKLSNSNDIGVGASYNVGLGNGINHLAFSSNGVSLRSFVDIKIKSSFSATGAWEYNYSTPFSSYQQLRQLEYWTVSGLFGVTKTISMKSRVFSKTKLSLLWDFMSYQQVPKTQPVIFRVGYTF